MKLLKYSLVVLVGLMSQQVYAQDYSVRPVNTCTTRGGLDPAYQQCIQDYNRRLNEYNMVHNTTSTGLRPPPQPNYSQCTRTDPSTGATTVDGTCRQQQDAAYQAQLQQYNYIRQQEIAAQNARALQQQQAEAARQAAQQAQQQNIGGGNTYGRSQILATVASVVAFSMCGPQNPAACAVGAFMAMQAGKAGEQKRSHAQSAWEACQTGNSYGATQVNCGPAPPPWTPTGFPSNTQPPLNEIVDTNGNCTGTVELCNDIRNGLPPGTSLRDLARGLSAFGGGGKSPATVDKDGNIITKDGKKFNSADLMSIEGLKKAGLSADQANALISSASKSAGGINDGSGKDGKNSLSGIAGLDGLIDESGAAGGLGAAGAGGAGGNGAADGSELDADKNKRRVASAEGLAKDFNGELIGVAGDDIFKMMNRRYKLKINQDAFMAP